MIPTDTISFCVAFLVWLALVTVAALECVQRFRFRLLSFIFGLAVLGLSFWFVMGAVTHWKMGQEMYQFQITYHYFRIAGFMTFLVFFLARGGYLLSRARK